MLKKLCLPALLLIISIQGHAAEQISPGLLKLIKSESHLSDGDVLYVDFWASWCTPCRKSFPWMNKMLGKYQESGLKVLAVNVDKDRALADKFLNSVKVDFPVFYDPDGELAQQFKLKGMPSSFLLDSEGNILKAHKGFFESKVGEYEQEIRKIIESNERATQ